MKNNRCSVVVIEPSEILAAGLSGVIGSSSGFEVTGLFSDVGKYQEQAAVHGEADLVIVNPVLVACGKKGALKTLFPDSRVVALLYSYVDRESLGQFQEVLEIYDKPAKILHKLEQLLDNAGPDSSNAEVGELTDREKDILIAVAKGLINKEIANLYNISIHTVISHRRNISRKTGIKSVSGFGVYALLNNLIEEYEIQ